MLKKILLGIAALLIVLAVIVQMQPEEFSYSRSASMNARPAEIFAQVNDLHKWENWSPWAKVDPNAVATYEGPKTGVGAKFNWSGNSEIGEGFMAITESKPHERIVMDLTFIRPMPGTSVVEFTFKPEGKGTLVTWSMSGKNNFIGKAMSLVIDCEKMIGEMYDQGLANLKEIAEK